MPKTYSGGIPFKRKEITEYNVLTVTPDRIFLLLPEGKDCLFNEGDEIKKYARLTTASENAPAVFSGVGGKIDAVRRLGKYTALSITSKESAEAEEGLPQPEKALSEMDGDELSALLLDRGVPFIERGKKDAKTLIVDCGGSQYNYSRLYICREFPDEVVGGAKIVMKLLGARSCRFAIPSSDLQAAQMIESRLPERSQMQKVVLFKEKLPANIPHLMVSAICGLEINGMRRVSDAGYPVISPLLCLAAYRALVYGIPFTESPVSVTEVNGELRILNVPFGAELEKAANPESRPVAVRAEGIVGKTVSGVMTHKVEAVKKDVDPEPVSRIENKCIRCLKCMRVCPAHIIPMDIYRMSLSKKNDRELSMYSTACFECYACSSVCPASLPVSETVIKLRRTNEAVAAQIVEEQLQEDLRALHEEMLNEAEHDDEKEDDGDE